TIFHDVRRVAGLLDDRGDQIRQALAQVARHAEWGVKLYGDPRRLSREPEPITAGSPGTAYLRQRNRQRRGAEPPARQLAPPPAPGGSPPPCPPAPPPYARTGLRTPGSPGTPASCSVTPPTWSPTGNAQASPPPRSSWAPLRPASRSSSPDRGPPTPSPPSRT